MKNEVYEILERELGFDWNWAASNQRIVYSRNENFNPKEFKDRLLEQYNQYSEDIIEEAFDLICNAHQNKWSMQQIEDALNELPVNFRGPR